MIFSNANTQTDIYRKTKLLKILEIQDFFQHYFSLFNYYFFHLII